MGWSTFVVCELIFVRAGISGGKKFRLRQGAELDSIAVSLFGNMIGVDKKYKWSSSYG